MALVFKDINYTAETRVLAHLEDVYFSPHLKYFNHFEIFFPYNFESHLFSCREVFLELDPPELALTYCRSVHCVIVLDVFRSESTSYCLCPLNSLALAAEVEYSLKKLWEHYLKGPHFLDNFPITVRGVLFGLGFNRIGADQTLKENWLLGVRRFVEYYFSTVQFKPVALKSSISALYVNGALALIFFQLKHYY
jgi:hypothetical protein